MEYYKPNFKIIEQCLSENKIVSFKDVEKILQKAFKFEKINLKEASILINSISDEISYNYIIKSADKLRRQIFDNYVKIYLPIYITNVCENNCIYCGFRRDNNLVERHTLSIEQFLKEINFLLKIGHRNIEVVLGYNPSLNKGSNLSKYIIPLRNQLNKLGGGSIIIMSEPMGTEDYEILRESGVSEVYTWQETYNKDRYQKVHPENTHKALYEWRVQVFDRAIEAGIKKIGMGILFGLYKWEYDELSLIQHAFWIREKYGIEPYAFGVPRFKKAHGALRQSPFYKVSNKMYILSVAIRRLIFPFTHTYMNTRENLHFLVDLLNSGGTEINTEASTIPGGYTGLFQNSEQFFHYSFDSRKVFTILEEKGFKATFTEIPLLVTQSLSKKYL